MNTNQIVSAIDAEISILRQARNLLAGHDGPFPMLRTPAKKRTISAAGRARIAAAQKARWAKQKKAEKKSA